MQDVSTDLPHSTTYSIPRGWIMLGLAALSWGLVIGAWHVCAAMFAFIAG